MQQSQLTCSSTFNRHVPLPLMVGTHSKGKQKEVHVSSITIWCSAAMQSVVLDSPASEHALSSEALHLVAAQFSGCAACCSSAHCAGSTLCDCNQSLAGLCSTQVSMHSAARHCISLQHNLLAVLAAAHLQTVLAAPCVTATSFLQG